MSNRIWCGAAAALVMLAAAPVAAQEFPTRAVRIIVPYAAGGPVDQAARQIAEALRRQLGESVIVETRPGAGGVTGAEAVARAEPDGYTLLMGAPGPLVINPGVSTVHYQVGKDLIPLGLVSRAPQVLTVSPKLSIKTLAAFVAYAKANPGKVNFGSAGNGTLPHLSVELFKKVAGIDAAHIPYRGTGAAIPDVMSGTVDAIFSDATTMAPFINNGSLVGLAVASTQRTDLLPDIPTTVEAGYPTMLADNWNGLLIPAGIPEKVRAKLESAVMAALKDPAYQAAMKKMGSQAGETSPRQFADYIKSETEKWVPLAKAAGVKLQ